MDTRTKRRFRELDLNQIVNTKRIRRGSPEKIEPKKSLDSSKRHLENCSPKLNLGFSFCEASFKSGDTEIEGVDAETVASVNRVFRKELMTPFINPRLLFSCRGTSACRKNKHDAKAESNLEEQFILCTGTEKCWNLLHNQLATCASVPNHYFDARIIRSLIYGLFDEGKFSLASAFKDILDYYWTLHPPCQNGLGPYYYEILFGNVKKENMHHEEVLGFSLYKVIELITSKLENVPPECSVKPDSSVSMKPIEIPKFRVMETVDELFKYISEYFVHEIDDSAMPVFRKELIQNKTVFLEYTEALTRLFMAYEVLVNLMEADLYVWLIKYRYKVVMVKFDILSRKHWPLVSLGTWEKGKEAVGKVNQKCRDIMKLLPICPPSHRYVIFRHISLIAEVVRVYEINPDKRFPFFSTLCDEFAKELSCSIAGSGPLNENVVPLVTKIEPSWLRMKVCGHLLNLGMSSNNVECLNNIVRLICRNLKPLPKKPDVPDSVNSYSKRKRQKFRNLSTGLKKNKFGETELHICCRSNNVARVKKLVAVKENDLNVTDNNGWRPLHEAAKFGSKESVMLLLKAGLKRPGKDKLDLTVQSNEGVTPLMDAVSGDHLEIVELLMTHGVSVTIYNKSNKGLSAMDLVTTEEIKTLMRNSYDRDICLFSHLNMSDEEVLLLEQLIFSYIKVYKVKQVGDTADTEGIRKDPIYTFDYHRYVQDNDELNNLISLISRLSSEKVNSKFLKSILSMLMIL